MGEQSVSHRDVGPIIKLFGQVARCDGPISEKRRVLNTGLSELIGAAAWSWILARAADGNHNPAVCGFQHHGLNARQLACIQTVMQDRQNPPPEYAKLNALRRTSTYFTKTWDQLVTKRQWYGEGNRPLMDVGIEHTMYCVRVLDGSGLFAGTTFRRWLGQPNFAARERNLVHFVFSELDWIHLESDSKLGEVTHQVNALSPRLRTTLQHLLGSHSIKEIATSMKLSAHTVTGYAKQIYLHFKVHSRPELMHYFQAGQNSDEPLKKTSIPHIRGN